jgi:hypothetical protein
MINHKWFLEYRHGMNGKAPDGLNMDLYKVFERYSLFMPRFNFYLIDYYY